MGFRFRRSFGVLPGVRINLGKRGASVSLGVRGAHVTIGPTGVRTTAGMPGTGASYTRTANWGHGTREQAPITPEARVPSDANVDPIRSGRAGLGWFVATVLFVILVVVLLSQ